MFRNSARCKDLKEFFDKKGYVYGFWVDVKVKDYNDDMSGTRWIRGRRTFCNFDKAVEWYLRGSGVRQLGDDYDREKFEEE